MNPIARGFRSLGVFRGRDTPGQFWAYAGVVLGGAMSAWIVAVFSVIASTVANLTVFAAESPSNPAGSADMPEPLRLGFQFLPLLMIVIVVGVIVLLAAAVARRLHDCGLAGFVGLAPIPFLFAGLFGGRSMMLTAKAQVTSEDPTLLPFLMINNLIYLALLGMLVVALCLPGQPKVNRYGPPPA